MDYTMPDCYNCPMQERENVVTERDLFLEDLRTRVKDAFKNRAQEQLLETGATQERLEKTEAVIATFEESGEEILEIGFAVDEPGQVTVANSHDYPDLLYTAFNELVRAGAFSIWLVDAEVERILEHEYAHHVPALGEEGLSVRYGIRFIEDKSKSYIGFEPAIVFEGRARKEVLALSSAAPHDSSAPDVLAIAAGF